ncbi:MAG: hypothetical protein K5664_01115 [Firmicutes bacterium]|nr:hypothetical protein [Bacillota bacterium]
MKKVLVALLSAYLILSALCGTMAAETETTQTPTGGFLPDEPIIIEMPVRTGTGKKSALRSRSLQEPISVYTYLKEQMKMQPDGSRAEAIPIYPTYEFSVPYEIMTDENGEPYVAITSISEFHKVLRTVLFDNYDIFVYDNVDRCSFCYSEDENDDNIYIEYFYPEYFLDASEEADAKAMMDGEINRYLAAANEIPDDDVVGKMLVIHDLFCNNNVYAIDEYREEKQTKVINNAPRTAYYLFKYKRAICQGNAIALKAIYDALNDKLKGTDNDIIKTSFCSSDNIAHIWNVVKIDGKWYHLDETGDDPVFVDNDKNVIETPFAYHLFFLKSYEPMLQLELASHEPKNLEDDWEYYADEEVVCDDDKYAEGYIFNTISEADMIDGDLTIYANTGQLITYEGGRYKLFSQFIGTDYPFWTNTIKATTVLATDPYDEEHNGIQYKTVRFFSNDAVDMKWYRISNRADGSINKCYIGSIQKPAGTYDYRCSTGNVPTRVFFWSPGSIKPLCHAIYVPAVVQ